MGVVLAYVLAAVCLIIFFKLIRIVPEQEAWLVERFGKYEKTLGSGMHLVIPFVQRVAYKNLLKEEVLDVEPQICITSDNVQVTVDGILYLKVMDPEKRATVSIITNMRRHSLRKPRCVPRSESSS